MPAQLCLAPVHSLPVPAEMRGTPRAIFFLLRGLQPRPQANPAPRPPLRPQRLHPAPRTEADTFVFQF